MRINSEIIFSRLRSRPEAVLEKLKSLEPNQDQIGFTRTITETIGKEVTGTTI